MEIRAKVLAAKERRRGGKVSSKQPPLSEEMKDVTEIGGPRWKLGQTKQLRSLRGECIRSGLDVTSNVRDFNDRIRPILLKNSLRAFRAPALGRSCRSFEFLGKRTSKRIQDDGQVLSGQAHAHGA